MDKPVEREKLYNLILSELTTGGYTAREISQLLYWQHRLVTPHRQEVAPRLTELVKMGKVEVIGKTFDFDTKKSVSIFGKVVE